MKSDTLAESLLHEIWKDQSRFLLPHPLLSDGSPIIINHPGDYNDHRGGPDFMNAEIVLDGMRIKGARPRRRWSYETGPSRSRVSWFAC